MSKPRCRVERSRADGTAVRRTWRSPGRPLAVHSALRVRWPQSAAPRAPSMFRCRLCRSAGSTRRRSSSTEPKWLPRLPVWPPPIADISALGQNRQTADAIAPLREDGRERQSSSSCSDIGWLFESSAFLVLRRWQGGEKIFKLIPCLFHVCLERPASASLRSSRRPK